MECIYLGRSCINSRKGDKTWYRVFFAYPDRFNNTDGFISGSSFEEDSYLYDAFNGFKPLQKFDCRLTYIPNGAVINQVL